MLDGRIVAKGMIITIPVMNGRIDLQVTHVSPGANAVIVNPSTRITISEEVAKPERNIPRVNYEDVGGLRDEITKVREMIELRSSTPSFSTGLELKPQRECCFMVLPELERRCLLGRLQVRQTRISSASLDLK